MDLSEEWRKLRPALGDMICHIDSKIQSIEAEEKRIQEKRDESYIRGLNDMAQAVIAFAGPTDEGCMTPTDLITYFGWTRLTDALNNMSPDTFVKAYDKWKADKEVAEKMDQEEIHVGDEVLIPGIDYFSYIVLYKVYDDVELVNVIEPTTLVTYIYSAKTLKKTGRHFDSIPLPKGECQ